MRRVLLTLGACVAAYALTSAPAAAVAGYCAPETGDYCYSVKRERGVVLLRFDTFSFGNPLRVCVRPPAGARECRSFKLSKRSGDVMGFSRRWSRHFPNRGKGTYKVSFIAFGQELGPGATFRI